MAFNNIFSEMELGGAWAMGERRFETTSTRSFASRTSGSTSLVFRASFSKAWVICRCRRASLGYVRARSCISQDKTGVSRVAMPNKLGQSVVEGLWTAREMRGTMRPR